MAAKVLLVDNYSVQSAGICNLLRFWGYEMCRQAASGQEAVKTAETERPDIILMDMDVSNDMNEIKALSDISVRYGIPIIFTSYRDENAVRKSLDTASVQHFVSPFELYKLHSIIDSLLEGSSDNSNHNSEIYSRN